MSDVSNLINFPIGKYKILEDIKMKKKKLIEEEKPEVKDMEEEADIE